MISFKSSSRLGCCFARDLSENRFPPGSSPGQAFSGSHAKLGVRPHPRGDDSVGIGDGLAALDLVDVRHALGHLPPDGVLTVEKRRIGETDEELAVAGIRVLRPRHGYGAAAMGLFVELGLELLARAAGAGTVRAAGLRHEAVDDAVEHDAVVE